MAFFASMPIVAGTAWNVFKVNLSSSGALLARRLLAGCTLHVWRHPSDCCRVLKQASTGRATSPTMAFTCGTCLLACKSPLPSA